jgi:hypothetical protein
MAIEDHLKFGLSGFDIFRPPSQMLEQIEKRKIALIGVRIFIEWHLSHLDDLSFQVSKKVDEENKCVASTD